MNKLNNRKTRRINNLTAFTPVHWSCMPSARRVSTRNVDSFIDMLERTEVLYCVSENRPDDVQHYTASDERGFIRGTELLYHLGDQYRIRVQLESACSDENTADDTPVKAALEVERIHGGCRRTYVSTDTQAILRVCRTVRQESLHYNQMKRLQEQVNEMRKQLDLPIVVQYPAVAD